MSTFVQFVRAQGVLLGLFVAMGIIVKELQSMFHSSARLSASAAVEPFLSSAGSKVNITEKIPLPGEDEFVTAMRMAAALDYPVRMSDAPQGDTLNSIKNVVSWDTLNPRYIVKDAKSLAFSALGWSPSGEKVLQERTGISTENLKQIYGQLQPEWISIPRVYAENWNMVKSLLPLAVIAVVSAILGITADVLDENGIGLLSQTVPEVDSSAVNSAISLPPLVADLLTTVAKALEESWKLLATSDFELTDEQAIIADTSIQGFFILLLLRLGKIIGSDRDKIIASKIMEICNEFPVLSYSSFCGSPPE